MRSFILLSATLALAATASASHVFTLVNQCSTSITPRIVNTSCGYSPRCPAGDFEAAQPATLAAGASTTVTIPDEWVGRIFAEDNCGSSGENCSITEFNLDSGDEYTPQSYDISNIQGFTQSLQISAAGCDTVTCTNANCGCSEAYPVGDTSGCGSDSPVKACGAGDIAFTVTFCP